MVLVWWRIIWARQIFSCTYSLHADEAASILSSCSSSSCIKGLFKKNVIWKYHNLNLNYLPSNSTPSHFSIISKTALDGKTTWMISNAAFHFYAHFLQQEIQHSRLDKFHQTFLLMYYYTWSPVTILSCIFLPHFACMEAGSGGFFIYYMR